MPKNDLENLKDKPKWGGSRPNSGRAKGTKNKATIEKKLAEDAFKQRILTSIDRLFNAQLNIAEGTSYVYKIVETGEGKNKKREHVLVTSPDEIKSFLDEHEGSAGNLGDEYYYITTHTPENKAIDSMIDRVFGKSTQKSEIDLNNPDGNLKTIIINKYGSDNQSTPETDGSMGSV